MFASVVRTIREWICGIFHPLGELILFVAKTDGGIFQISIFYWWRKVENFVTDDKLIVTLYKKLETSIVIKTDKSFIHSFRLKKCFVMVKQFDRNIFWQFGSFYRETDGILQTREIRWRPSCFTMILTNDDIANDDATPDEAGKPLENEGNEMFNN